MEDMLALDHAFDKIYHSFNRFGRTLGSDEERHPEYTRVLLDSLGGPDGVPFNVMVTGSKGKGSTAYFIARLLATKSPTVGLFTSPHLVDSLERIRVNGSVISQLHFMQAFKAVEPALDRLHDILPPGRYIGPVGVFAVLAAWYFHRRGAQWGVYETGRGARFDDVAQVQHQASVITAILPEHLKELGPDVEKIAWHKAGVVSSQTKTLVLGSDNKAMEKAVDRQIEVLGADPHIVRAHASVGIRDLRIDAGGSRFTLELADGRRWVDLRIPMLGRVVENLRTAIATVEAVAGKLNEGQVRNVLAGARWPGRGEIISQRPWVLLDAAIRPESLGPLLAELPPFDCAVLSIPDDKDRSGVAALVKSHSRRLILTTCSNPRLSYRLDRVPPTEGVSVVPAVNDALDEALNTFSPESRVLLCGTISFVADVYRYLGRQVD